MRSYLSLIPISAKVRRRQNRVTLLCIVLSVFLVTAMFSAAENFVRTEAATMEGKHGSWHLQVEGLPQATVEEIRQRADVTAMGWSESFNLDTEQPYYVGEKTAVLTGADETYFVQMMNGLEEGRFPRNESEVVLSANGKLALGVEIGDVVTVHTPTGDAAFTVSGFGADDKEYFQGQTYLVAVCMTREAFHSLMAQNGVAENPICSLQFQTPEAAAKARAELPEAYGLPAERISENTAVMGLAGQSDKESFNGIYLAAAFLFVLVLLAGVLMISGSLNSNVAQRTQFFGMLRCVGASRRQIIRFVRLEALNWCKTAVPVGLVLGTGISWGICAYLRYGIGGDEFVAMPVVFLSPMGLVSGTLVGLVTVLLAAQAPARKAAKVSPASAVSGNAEPVSAPRRGRKGGFGRIEWTLGIHHGMGSGKNWFLMTASFALSIILFLCFSVGLNFARELLPTLRSYQPDITLNGYANACLLEQGLIGEIEEIPGVERAFGSSYLEEVPATSSRQGIDRISLESYDDFLLESAKDRVVQGDLSDIPGDSGKGIIIQNKDNPLQVGDTVQIAGGELEITCAISDGLFPGEQLVICSQETFARLTGEEKYTMIGVQVNESADDETVRQINSLAAQDVIFTDHRESNRSDQATYLATQAIAYGFLGILAMITLFHTINSISISVISRTKQYGAMRAVGMSGSQLTRMIAAEAFTYAASGLIAGLGIGIPLSLLLHLRLVTRYFGTAWHLPAVMLGVIVAFVFACAVIAVWAPAKRMRNLAITETINEL